MSDSAAKAARGRRPEPGTSKEILEAAARECHRGWRGYAITLVGHARGPGLAQEAFLVAWRAEPALSSVRHADRYVLKCIRTLTAKLRASRSERAAAQRRLQRELSDVVRPATSLWVDLDRCWAELRQSGLPVRELKEAYYLNLGGFSCRQIGTIQGCGKSTAHERVARAEVLVREFFANPPDDLGSD